VVARAVPVGEITIIGPAPDHIWPARECSPTSSPSPGRARKGEPNETPAEGADQSHLNSPARPYSKPRSTQVRRISRIKPTEFLVTECDNAVAAASIWGGGVYGAGIRRLKAARAWAEACPARSDYRQSAGMGLAPLRSCLSGHSGPEPESGIASKGTCSGAAVSGGPRAVMGAGSSLADLGLPG